jgi:hypothetical protein
MAKQLTTFRTISGGPALVPKVYVASKTDFESNEETAEQKNRKVIQTIVLLQHQHQHC